MAPWSSLKLVRRALGAGKLPSCSASLTASKERRTRLEKRQEREFSQPLYWGRDSGQTLSLASGLISSPVKTRHLKSRTGNSLVLPVSDWLSHSPTPSNFKLLLTPKMTSGEESGGGAPAQGFLRGRRETRRCWWVINHQAQSPEFTGGGWAACPVHPREVFAEVPQNWRLLSAALVLAWRLDSLSLKPVTLTRVWPLISKRTRLHRGGGGQ